MQKISGFTYVRNGFKYGVPFVESIKSILPICSEFIAVVGDSDDGTREAILDIASDKIRIVDTIWDMTLRKGGKVFAQQSNTGLDEIVGDWGFHIQADEVIHEKDLPVIVEAIELNNSNQNVDGLLFPFLHFWGDYNHLQDYRKMHRREIRVFKNKKYVRAYRDSQGFRLYDSLEGYNTNTDKGKKLRVKLLNTPVYHYNGVRENSSMKGKAKNFSFFYGEDIAAYKEEKFNYNVISRVKKFKGVHPLVMNERISEYDFEFVHDKTQAKWRLKDRILQPIEDIIGYRFGEYKNYVLVK